LCVTVLKQRCREHGITRWPYRKVKKLDTIITALGGAARHDGLADATDADRRLSAVRRTRESLITDPNSDAHLRVGKLKAIRRRISSGSGSGSGDEGSFGSDGGARAGSGASGQTTLTRPRAARLSSGGVDGLLEAAASLSDGEETPGTPTRDPDGIRDRSPRISGLLSAVEHERLNAAGGSLAAGEAAAALGALYRPAGAAGAFAPVKPSAIGAHAAASAPEGVSLPHLPAAIPAALDPKAYAAALAAFAQGMSAAAQPASSAPWTATAAAPQMQPHALFAWMAAMSAAPPPPIAAPPVPQWNAETLQRLAETMQAAARVGATAATAGNPVTAASESAHQPL
jgi:hypothetical protein